MTEPNSDATPRGPYRRFTAHHGTQWLVWLLAASEVEELRDPPSLGRAWLIFLGPDGLTRRLAPVPTGWRRMPEAELAKLAVEAKAFGSRIYPLT